MIWKWADSSHRSDHRIGLHRTSLAVGHWRLETCHCEPRRGAAIQSRRPGSPQRCALAMTWRNARQGRGRSMRSNAASPCRSRQRGSMRRWWQLCRRTIPPKSQEMPGAPPPRHHLPRRRPGSTWPHWSPSWMGDAGTSPAW